MPRSNTPDVFASDEARVLDGFSRPEHVQAFLDTLRYSEDPIYRSPRSVLRDGKAHCFDGALFAAAALERLGFPPRLVDLRAVRDDGLEAVATALDAVRHTPVLTPAQIQRLARVDERTYQAQLLGSNAAGLYRPGGHKG
jgi:hypothetical protein